MAVSNENRWFRLMLLVGVMVLVLILYVSYIFIGPASTSDSELPDGRDVIASFKIGGESPGVELPVIRARVRQNIKVKVKSDVAGLLMVHGLTEGIPISANGEATLSIIPHVTGRFAIHLHRVDGGHQEVAYLEVYP